MRGRLFRRGDNAREAYSPQAFTPAITVTQGTIDGTGTVGAATLGSGTGAILANEKGDRARQ